MASHIELEYKYKLTDKQADKLILGEHGFKLIGIQWLTDMFISHFGQTVRLRHIEYFNLKTKKMDYRYFLTYKTPLKVGRWEIEKELEKLTYEVLLKHPYMDNKVIEKNRLCFVKQVKTQQVNCNIDTYKDGKRTIEFEMLLQKVKNEPGLLKSIAEDVLGKGCKPI